MKNKPQTETSANKIGHNVILSKIYKELSKFCSNKTYESIKEMNKRLEKPLYKRECIDGE